MTSNRGAGFSSNPRGRFDPLNQGKSALGSGTGSSLLPKKQEPSSEEVRRSSDVLKPEQSVLFTQQPVVHPAARSDGQAASA